MGKYQQKNKMKISDELENLKLVDIYSLMMFALFKMQDIPEYSTLSELVYVLDKENLLKLCEYFGGLTLKIPTIDDLESLVFALLVYQKVDIENMPLEDALALANKKSLSVKKIKSDYIKLKEVLNEYNFKKS